MGTPIEPEPVQGISPDEGGNSPGPNPAWSEVLDILPEQFHSVVTPHFQKWDQSAQSRIEQANESLKEFESYKPYIEHGISNEEIEQGLRLMYEINNNPQNVYSALADAYKFGQTPGAGTTPDAPEGGAPNAPLEGDPVNEEVNQLRQGLELVSKIVLNDAQAKQAATADAELTREMDKLRTDFGEYDDDYVLTKMMNGMSGEDAVKAYQKLVTPKSFAPNLLGSGGSGSGLPSNAIDPTKLSGKETRNLVAEMLAQAAKTS